MNDFLDSEHLSDRVMIFSILLQ